MIGALLRFGVSGALATLCHVTVFVLLVEWFGTRPVLAAGPAFLLAMLVSYGMNYHWTFTVSGPHRLLLPRFTAVALLGLGLNLGITYLVVDILHGWYGYALLLVIMIVPLVAFSLSKFWVFRE